MIEKYNPIWREGEYAFMRNASGILWRRRITPDYKYHPWEIVDESETKADVAEEDS